MAISAEQLQTILQQQQKQFEQAQMRLIEQMTKRIEVNPNKAANSSLSTESAVAAITEFNYDTDTGCIFGSWFRKYEDMFETDFAHVDDAAKVRILLRKLGTAEHERSGNDYSVSLSATLTL